MKITRIETIPVLVPLKKGMTTRTAHGEHVLSSYVIVRVHTDQGLVGLGEATVSALWSGETSGSCVTAIRELFEPALVGHDPRQITAHRLTMERLLKRNPFTKSAVEMALWDLAGKAAGVPVYQLLGGKLRNRIPIKMMVGAFDLPRACGLAEQYLAWGVKCIKVKVGLDPAGDIARVEAIRKLAGDTIPMTVDGNCGWNLAQARLALRRIQESQLRLIEQPIPADDLEAQAELRRELKSPLMADESVFTLPDAWRVTAAQAADIISVYPGKNGGIADTIEIAHVAKAAGICCAIGSNLELGVGTAAMLHVAAAVKEIDSETYPADIIGPLYHETDLLKQPLSLGPEFSVVPDGLGLGVELDDELLQRFRAD